MHGLFSFPEFFLQKQSLKRLEGRRPTALSFKAPHKKGDK